MKASEAKQKTEDFNAKWGSKWLHDVLALIEAATQRGDYCVAIPEHLVTDEQWYRNRNKLTELGYTWESGYGTSACLVTWNEYYKPGEFKS